MDIYCLKNGKIETSDWMLKNHAECERKAFYSNILGIEPRDLPADSPLSMGDAWHECMETLHAEAQSGTDQTSWAKVIDAHYGSALDRFNGGATSERDVWGATFFLWLQVMVQAYRARWGVERWAEAYPETWFRQPVIHPELGTTVEGVTHKGAIDLLVRADRSFVWGDSQKFRLPAECSEGWYLKECKTATKVDDAYIGRLIADDQITMYAHYLGREKGIVIDGVLYDVAIKPPKKTKLEADESDADFAKRKAKLQKDAQAGKMGKRLRQKIGETPDQLKARRVEKGVAEAAQAKRGRRTNLDGFKARLEAYYRSQDRFVRVFVPLRPDITRAKLLDQYHRITRIKESIERLDQRIPPEDLFIRNWGSCWPQKGKCEFWQLCTSGTPQDTLQENYVRRRARKTAARHIIKELIASAPDADDAF